MLRKYDTFFKKSFSYYTKLSLVKNKLAKKAIFSWKF